MGTGIWSNLSLKPYFEVLKVITIIVIIMVSLPKDPPISL